MSTRRQFRDALVTAFTQDELSILCNDLGVDPEVIAGLTLGQETYADNLITYFEKRSRIDDLLGALRNSRPAVNWSYQPRPLVLAVPAPPKRWAIAGAGVLLAVATAALLLRARPNPLENVSRATQPAAATKPMPGKYNIVVADFVQVQANTVHTSTDGIRLSQHFADALKRELAEGITPDARADLSAVIWDASDMRANGWTTPNVSSDAEAEALARTIDADLIVYGRIEPESATAGDSAFYLGFYQVRRNGLAEELGGGYALGAPMAIRIPMSTDMDTAARMEVNVRQRLLLRFALGALYDRLGRNEQALSVFRNMATLPSGDSGPTGAAIAYLTGREYLLLKQPDQAQAEHERALQLDETFVRAHLGLGDVNYQRMVQVPAGQRLASPELAQAKAHYKRAEQLAVLRADSTRLATIARLGQGLVALAEADAHSLADSVADSGRAAAEAVALIEPSTLVLKTDSGADPRTLAAAYLGLGNASTLAALAAIGEDESMVKAARARAQNSYTACIKLDVRTDPLLSADLTDLCKKGLGNLESQFPE